ncbi:hypothetical protein AnigIFM63604_000828 [Aspergillus niger]|uniref:Uncharacterized protein n=2 Tax=Aspergillus TaxID=5052 RepID=A0A370PGA8_ASPPH|nr:hypothetical protein M752DRAFT_336991 [Aspergillus phoenicis ATCC 13157]GLA54682.1 hypothetical protein AnigIFM63604_000828 [Aspergillus niger]
MRKLSTSMLSYYKKHGLFDQLLGRDESSSSSLSMSPFQRSVFSFFLLFAVYEEVVPDFSIAGGDLSGFILSDEKPATSIFASPRTCHEYFFGAGYPPAELIGDMQRSAPLELNLHAHIAMQQLNMIQKSGKTTVAGLQRILDLVQTTKKRYSARFKVVEFPCESNMKFLRSDLSATSILNAVLIDTLDSLGSLLQDENIVQQLVAAHGELLHCVFQLVNLSNPRLTWRVEWLAYVALTWSADEIHVEWLLDKLGDSRYVMLFRHKTGYNRQIT